MASEAQQAQEALTVNYVNLCAISPLIYDTFLNMENEVEYIWRKEWSFVNGFPSSTSDNSI